MCANNFYKMENDSQSVTMPHALGNFDLRQKCVQESKGTSLPTPLQVCPLFKADS